jgi:hypothetical protein
MMLVIYKLVLKMLKNGSKIFFEILHGVIISNKCMWCGGWEKERQS